MDVADCRTYFLIIGLSHNKQTYSVFTICPSVACSIFSDAVVFSSASYMRQVPNRQSPDYMLDVGSSHQNGLYAV